MTLGVSVPDQVAEQAGFDEKSLLKELAAENAEEIHTTREHTRSLNRKSRSPRVSVALQIPGNARLDMTIFIGSRITMTCGSEPHRLAKRSTSAHSLSWAIDGGRTSDRVAQRYRLRTDACAAYTKGRTERLEVIGNRAS